MRRGQRPQDADEHALQSARTARDELRLSAHLDAGSRALLTQPLSGRSVPILSACSVAQHDHAVTHLAMEGQLQPDHIQEIVPGVVSCNSSCPAAITLARDLCERFLDHVIDELIL